MARLPEKTFCMAPLATALHNGRATVDQYLDNLLCHVITGGLEHPDDKPGPRSRRQLTDLATSDPVCGAFRMWALDPAYPRVEPGDVGQLKSALLAAWITGTLPGRERIGALDPTTMPLVQVIAAIVFRRQEAGLQARAFTLALRPPAETVFDVIDLQALSDAFKSPPVWDCVLRSGWIHQPPPAGSPPYVTSTRAPGWASIMERGLTSPATCTAQQLSSFLRALRDEAVLPNVAFPHGLLVNGAVQPNRLAVFFDVFPARGLHAAPARAPALPETTSPNSLILAAASSPASEEDRVGILDILLKQGLDPKWMPVAMSPYESASATMTRPPGIDWRVAVDDWYDSRPRARDAQNQDRRETALHVAAERGDVEIAKTLVRHGANTATRDGKGLTPRERAGNTISPEMDKILLQDSAARGGWFGFRGLGLPRG